MVPGSDLDLLLRTLEPVLHPGRYAFVGGLDARALDPESVVASVREAEGLSVVVPADDAPEPGVAPARRWSWITLSVASDLEAVGLTAAVATALRDAGISCNVVAGTHHDHLFVPEALGQEALNVLRALQAGSGSRPAVTCAGSGRLGDELAPFHIRGARPDDTTGVASLLDELGYPCSVAALGARLERLRGPHDEVLVADRDGALVGLATVHVTSVLHRPAPVGRLTSLIVTEAARGRGVGRALVEAAERWLAGRGCGLVEVTSNRRRTDAHAFYARLGYETTSLRFNKGLPDPALARQER